MKDSIDGLRRQLGQPCLDTQDGDVILNMIESLDERIATIEQKLEAAESYEREQAERTEQPLVSQHEQEQRH